MEVVGRRLGSRVLGSLKPRDVVWRLTPTCDDHSNEAHFPARAAVGDSRRWSSSDVRGALKGNVADVAIIGGGIVGLATAQEIVQRFPKATVCVVEKEKDLVKHQTSHNSGVIHAGIYYEPGSEMARLCVDGARRMYEYCEAKGLPYKRVGKLIIATREEELPVLDDLHFCASANGVQGLEMLSSKQITDPEPNVVALRALHSPNTGITDYAKVGRSYAEDFLASDRGQIRTESVALPPFLPCWIQNQERFCLWIFLIYDLLKF